MAKLCRRTSISFGSTWVPYHPTGAATAQTAPIPPRRNCLLVASASSRHQDRLVLSRFHLAGDQL